jgi:hypothetical protein
MLALRCRGRLSTDCCINNLTVDRCEYVIWLLTGNVGDVNCLLFYHICRLCWENMKKEKYVNCGTMYVDGSGTTRYYR